MDPDSIVITGMAGRFPGCDNVQELQKALIEGVDLVSEDHDRWTKDFYNLNNRAGIMKDIDHFDYEFFGVTPRQAEGMDPKTRILLELTLEALVDAGLNPLDVKGSRTAVLVGMTTPRGNVEVFDNKINFQRMGRSPAMSSAMISFLFDLRGPSYPIDTACSSSLFAFCQAFRAIKGGECDAAIVCGATLTLDPFDSLEYKTMNILSPSGKCRFLDEARDGFVKSESVVVTVLQKRKDAKRIYATVKGCGTNTDGFKIDGVTKPSPEMQTHLFKEVMTEFDIHPEDFTYLEAHGTGTPVGDFQETTAIAESICVGRKEPLLIGSVKTNIGHTEMASGVTSIIKVVLTMEHGVIPPILHLDKIGDEFTAFQEGKLKAVTELTPWKKGLIGINSFGIGGTNANVVLAPNAKEKTKDNNAKLNYRLLVLSGRNEKGLNNFVDLVKNDPNNLELMMFLNNIFYKPLRFYSHKACLIFNNEKILEETSKIEKENRKVWFVYSGIGSQWPHMCKDLMKFDVFKKLLEECAEPLKSHNIDLINLLTEGDDEAFKNVTNCFISIVAMSVCLTDILKLLGVEPDGMVGHSVGEIGCAYCDGLISKEQAMLIAHARGKALTNTSTIEGTLAVVGLTEEELSKTLPADISIACYNSKDNLTISGPRKSIENYVNELKQMNTFAEIVKGAEMAFHSDYISEAGDLLVEILKDIIPVNKLASGKWIASASDHKAKIRMNGVEALDKIYDSVPNEQKILHCPEYYRKNLVHPVLFSSAMKTVPKDALVIEISPKGLLQSVIKRNLGPEAKVLSLSSDSSADNYEFLLSSIGRLYLAGLYPNILKLYQDNDVLFPLSRGTPSLAPLIEWEKTACKVPYYSPEKAFGESIVIDIREPSMNYLEGHKIDDKMVFPVVGYANVAWEIFAHLQQKPLNEVPIVIENMQIKRATVIQPDSNIIFNGNILSNGDFEILESGSLVCTGTIKHPGNINKLFSNISEEHLKKHQLPENCLMNKDDIYHFFKILGLQYRDKFQGILESKGSVGILKWNDIWTPFLDTAVHYTGVLNFTKKFYLPESIGMIIIDPQAHLKIASENNDEIPLKYDIDSNIIQCGKLEIRDLRMIEINRRKVVTPKLETHQFIPYNIPQKISLFNGINLTVQIVLENSNKLSVINILEVSKEVKEDKNESEDVEKNKSILSQTLKDVISDEVTAKVGYDKTNKLPTSKRLEKYDLIVIDEEFEENIFNPLRNNEKCFILLKSINSRFREIIKNYEYYVVVSTFSTEDCNYCLIRLKQIIPKGAKIINVSSKSLDWVNTLKDSLKNVVENRVYLVSEDEETCGIIGLFTCLRFEEGGTSIRAIFVTGKSPAKFSLHSEFWREQLEKDLSVNVLRNDVWGSYRFLPYEKVEFLETDKCFAISTAPGDLSKIKMIDQSPHFRNPKNVVSIYYAGANFKDVLIGSGMFNVPGSNQNITELGFEYSGRTADGQRVFGITTCHAFATVLETDFPIWKVPDAWTLEEAASVPIIYLTLFYAFRYKTHLKKGRSILVHSASGGVGMAAIQWALNIGCKIFATVGNDQKRKKLLKLFPKLEEKNIFSSRDSNFEILVKQETRGRGVDYVLNSLTGDLFNASLRCVAVNGHFIEIGKIEFLTTSKIQSGLFQKSASLHAVSIDQFMNDEPKEILDSLFNFFETEILKIRPIPYREVFDIEDIENGLKHFQSNSHFGKIIFKVRNEEANKCALPCPKKMSALPKLYFNPNKSYVIVGGLGGLGLELLRLICISGGKHIILNSRNPPGKGFKQYFIRNLRSWDCEISLNHDDASIFSNAQKLLKEANKKVPLGGIFNLAMVNRDAILENQTVELFEEVFRPKALITANMDKLTRENYPDLDHFVVYSSVTCGKGNLGQTNYGFANSTMERIIERRNQDGLPGLVIQWGPMGDTGYFARTSEKQDLGYLTAQPISSYREVLQQVLLKSSGVVTSYVVRITQDIQKGDSLFEALMKMFGITNLSKVSDESTLLDLGLDSLMGFEIKQYLLREYEIDISTNELRNKTMKEIKEIDKKRRDHK